MKTGDTWCWRRRISIEDEAAWLEKLSGAAWTLTGKPGAARPLLCVYTQTQREPEAWQRQFGGRVSRLRAATWLAPRVSPPLRIGKSLEIVSEAITRRPSGGRARLVIPHGLAFGSGEHATTAMLLRALARRRDLPRCRVLDLGTGSGILALAARQLGARKITATDFDAVAIRSARENEARNFAGPLIRWQRTDVKRLAAKAGYEIVLANLFSGILVEAAGRIAASVAPGGTLWLSGILREQERLVVAAYRKKKVRLVRAARRGKWVLLEWRKDQR